ncbi:MAG: hypothetical protein FWC73_05155 [Defluviitaleaceae bacterium]|nr:hypothetical protein [Defluviitaleaceae bacterium]
MHGQKTCRPILPATAEETGKNLAKGRGDAYCGMLKASYSLGLRGVKAYIPEYPVGTAMIGEFLSVARTLIALKKLKVFTAGRHPFNFIACTAPIKPLFDLGIEMQQNSV